MKAPARTVAILTSAVVLLVGMAGSATADSPSTWVDAESRSWLENLIFFGGSTVALIVGISLFALVTARNNYVPPPPGTDVEVADPH
ncbi:MAG: hypothetical protein WAL70_01345 [Aeromicrobium sp.]